MWATMECSTLVITGDLNLDRLRPERKEGQILLNLEEIYGLECLIKDPTRITPTLKTLLDVILTNKPEFFKASGVFNPEMSDHNLVYGIMKERVAQHERKVITFRSTKTLDVEKFNEDLSCAPWNVMDTFDTLDEKYDYWESLFNTIIEKHMPTKRMRFRKFDVPYMTPKWKNAIKMKRKFAKQYAQEKTEENWELKRKWRNKAANCRRQAIKEYWQKKAEDLKAKPSDFYKTFRPFLSDKKQAVSEIHIRTTDDSIEKDQEKVANVLANYFSTMANEIGGAGINSLTEEDLSSHPSLTNIYNASKSNPHNNFCFKLLSRTSVQSVLEKLNVRKASGYDSISPKILRLASSGLAESLTKLFNECIRKGEWPEAWKRGEWNPVHKKCDRFDERNYRPITLLSVVDKVYESMMSTQVNNHYDCMLDPSLSAYRKKHSCETTLLRLTEDWKLAVDCDQFIGILSTDMSKAFDSLHPSLMLNKLKAYGFSEEALNLMRSYFTNRRNRVKLSGVYSNWKEAVRGCPQGSSFGPLLWNIFQNDMTYTVKNSNLSMYADDHQLYVRGDTVSCVEQLLNNGGHTISKWYKENFLKGNYDKYNLMLLGRKNKTKDISSINIKIDEEIIKSSPDLKLLGVTLDDELSYSTHISEICKKTSKKVGVLVRLRNMIPREAKLQLYKSAILPNLTYCHIVWHFCKAADARKLEKIQERALRAVYNDKNATYEELLKKGKLCSLENRRLQDIIILMYKVKNSLAPEHICNIFFKQHKHYNLRSDFPIPRYNTVQYGKHSIRYLGPYIWGKISQELRSKTSLQAFRKAVRTLDVLGLLDGTCGCSACSS